MTFFAFREDGKLFLARESESPKPPDPGVRATKASNLRALHDTAKSLGVDELLTQAAQFIEARIGGYCWPGKQAYSYSLQETTDSGTPSLRTYAIELTFGNNDWASLEQPLDKFLAAVVEGWKRGSASARRSAESNLLDS